MDYNILTMILRVQHDLFDMPLSALTVFVLLGLIFWVAYDQANKLDATDK